MYIRVHDIIASHLSQKIDNRINSDENALSECTLFRGALLSATLYR